MVRDCYQRKESGNEGEEMKPNVPNEEQKFKGILCFNCKAREHFARNCPKALFCNVVSSR